ncbi:hypothetical protein HU200_038600 [Digitaria exilis]|uniref:Uncharacterized protein n=1 Tax=Digitaria exilis TaxID=1010633 RepID=A0A835ELR3_9POAL|nr:hypothetical protein HU200_038600 [Digitaria exilis]
MRNFYRSAYRKNARPGAVARAAVRFSAENNYFCRAPLLKSLRLSRCNISDEGFEKAIEKFPLLEELELELCESVGGSSVYEFISEACPQLKHYGHRKERYRWRIWISDGDADCEEALAIARMHELRSLQLFRINLSNEGLVAILDGCPHLEYLDVRNCCNIIMDDTLRAKCARIKKKKLLVYRSNDECMDFEPGSPISYCSTCCGMGDESDGDNDILDIADLEDFSDSSYDLMESMRLILMSMIGLLRRTNADICKLNAIMWS